MSRQSMSALRAQRAADGLVQVNLWVRQDDLPAFREAVAPFRYGASGLAENSAEQRPESPAQACSQGPVPTPPAALQPTLRLCRVRFAGHVPPAELQVRMQPPAWDYDDTSDLWTGRWPNGAGPDALRLVEDLRACLSAQVSVQPPTI